MPKQEFLKRRHLKTSFIAIGRQRILQQDFFQQPWCLAMDREAIFPRQMVAEKDITAAKLRDKQLKEKNEVVVNSSKYRKQSHLDIGDLVYVRSFNKQKKFDPVFLDVPFVVTDINDQENKIRVKEIYDDTTYYGDLQPPDHDIQSSSLPYSNTPISLDESYDDTSYFQPQTMQPNQTIQEG